MHFLSFYPLFPLGKHREDFIKILMYMPKSYQLLQTACGSVCFAVCL